ncbi:MAG: hypothetical protein OXC70_02200 [Gammaproteobacteria bacterium]|nr:hypothetical protein [Gammaproteobacteria bacterium]
MTSPERKLLALALSAALAAGFAGPAAATVDGSHAPELPSLMDGHGDDGDDDGDDDDEGSCGEGSCGDEDGEEDGEEE